MENIEYHQANVDVVRQLDRIADALERIATMKLATLTEKQADLYYGAYEDQEKDLEIRELFT